MNFYEKLRHLDRYRSSALDCECERDRKRAALFEHLTGGHRRSMEEMVAEEQSYTRYHEKLHNPR